ncbi:hypothetical protein QE320_gp016 [Pseudomonas phage EM]|uniref:Transmembrane protein n=1 Tax=Pseudomonas phage EM TaxID=2936914 RepID=A0AAE9HI39_9CAUD|nr:hypothetical protein QE320_gp016 [Pseudomonas phage EM]UPW35818.1 hypothetical protein EM_016 [Pseudomonas phage EM]
MTTVVGVVAIAMFTMIGMWIYGFIGFIVYSVWCAFFMDGRADPYSHQWMRRRSAARAMLAGIFWPISVPLAAVFLILTLPVKFVKICRVAITGGKDEHF